MPLKSWDYVNRLQTHLGWHLIHQSAAACVTATRQAYRQFTQMAHDQVLSFKLLMNDGVWELWTRALYGRLPRPNGSLEYDKAHTCPWCTLIFFRGGRIEAGGGWARYEPITGELY